MTRHPPNSTPFPYTTLSRSPGEVVLLGVELEPPQQLHGLLGVGLLLPAPDAGHQRPQEALAALVLGAQQHVLQHRSEEHTSELQSRQYLVCRLLLEKKKKRN